MKRFLSIFFMLGLIILSSCSKEEITEYHYISLAMGPNVDLFLDQEDLVTHFAPLNEDAKILLAGMDLLDMTRDEVLLQLVDTLIDTGYIDILSVQNSIAIYAESTANPDYQEEIVELLENYLHDQAIGCVVIQQQDIGLVQETTYNDQTISYFQSKMIELYTNLNEEVIYDEFVDKSINELTSLVKSEFDQTLSLYRLSSEVNDLITKNAYTEDLALLIDYFRQGVTSGFITQPSLSAITNLFLTQYQIEIGKMSLRNQERATYIENKEEDDFAELLIGEFEASVFIGNFPYTLDYYRLTFYEGNTYAESWKITSGVVVTTSDYVGSYTITDGHFVSGYPGTNLFNLFLSRGKICAYDQDGNLLVFHEINPTN